MLGVVRKWGVVNSTTHIMELFSQVPFLNGGLFECLDRKEKEGKIYDWDGFSRNPKYQARIPNKLFFAKVDKVDLSGEYNNSKMKEVKVSGIIEILNRYNFTIEENTPVEIEVALDPELLGKVFENLLGAFNPETQETARKQTGSFYTPREIVNYMVDESLIAYFQTKVPEIEEEKLRFLFSYEDHEVEINETLSEKIIQAAFDCKILDPACGSGAFPMGILQQMVHILKKLDPDNSNWNNVVMAQAMKDFDKADKLSDEDRETLLEEINSTFNKGLNYPDYARKLHLIENCIYGVDIQSIAVQISKLRFFISLVCEQNRNTVAFENFGIRPLPNLETKFVAANTLIGLEKTEEDLELFNDSTIKTLIDKLQHIRHRQFLVTTATEKKRLREKDQKLREEIENEVTTLYVKHADERLSRNKLEIKSAENQLVLLLKMPDDIRKNVVTDLFGDEKIATYNVTENKRKDLKTKIKILTEKIEKGSDYSRLNSVISLARQLTSWNPYDQNNHSEFFDPEWMFGLTKVEALQEVKPEKEILLLNAQIKAINAQIEAINISFSLNNAHEIIKLQLVTALAQAGIIEFEFGKIRNDVNTLYGRIHEPISNVMREPVEIEYTVNALNKNIDGLNRQLETITIHKPFTPTSQGGYFDVVIGNPPYIGQSGNKEIFRTVKSNGFGKKYHRKRMDYFYFFVHYAIDNLKQNGVLSFITTNYFFNATCANVLRTHIREKMSFISVVNFNESKVFASAQGQHNTVYNLIKNNNYERNIKVIFSSEKTIIDNNELNLILNGKHKKFKYFDIQKPNLYEDVSNNINCTSIIENDQQDNDSISNLFSGCLKLNDVCDINQGILTGANSVTKGNSVLVDANISIGDGIYILTNDELDSLSLSKTEMDIIKPWYKNSNIKQYITTKPNPFWLIYAKLSADIENKLVIFNYLKKFENIIKDRNFESGELSKAKRLDKWWALSSARSDFDFSQPKIVCPQRSPKNTFAYTEDEWFAASDVYFITNKKNISLNIKFFLGVLNSKLIYYWLYNKGQRKGDILQLFKGPLLSIPIKLPNTFIEGLIVTEVESILMLKQSGSKTDLNEYRIDNLVYRLYDLTYSEVKVIDPEIESKLSEAEYNAIEI